METHRKLEGRARMLDQTTKKMNDTIQREDTDSYAQEGGDERGTKSKTIKPVGKYQSRKEGD